MSTTNPKLMVSLSPHVKAPISTAKIMWGVVIALLPALGASVWVFGPQALAVSAVSVFTCVLTEYLIQTFLFSKKKKLPALARGYKPGETGPSILDGSAVITGLLLAMNLSASVPLWQIVIGAIFSIGVAKMVFGGLGHNPFNPALAGRAFMLASFPVEMTSFPKAFAWSSGSDIVSGATALGSLKEGVKQGLTITDLGLELPNHLQLFLGGIGGSLGEVSALALLIGGLLMLFIRLISWESPVSFLGGLFLITGLVWLIDPTTHIDPIYHLLSGGAFLAAFFMVTDMVTSPMSVSGRIVFAFSAGLLTGLIRLFGSFPEGASYAILIMNAFVPLIDRGLPPGKFGKKPFIVKKESAV